MMKYIKTIPLFFIALMVTACNEWTEPAVEKPTDMFHSIKTPTYYANLRAYKTRAHTITYAKWGGWTGTGSVLNRQLTGLPDSLDIVALIDGYDQMTSEKQTDLQHVRQTKGTRIVMAVSIKDLGDGLPEGTTFASVEEYAQALAAVVNKNNLDGIDIELRPSITGHGTVAGNTAATEVLVNTLATHFGPVTANGKLLILSGEPTAITPALVTKFNYIAAYVFGATTDQTLDNTLQNFMVHLDGILAPEDIAKKIIVVEDFENNSNGGVLFKDRFANTMLSLEGMARWLPIINQHRADKGGVGIYHLEKEYTKEGQNSTYPYTHQIIQILNPSIK